MTEMFQINEQCTLHMYYEQCEFFVSSEFVKISVLKIACFQNNKIKTDAPLIVENKYFRHIVVQLHSTNMNLGEIIFAARCWI